MSFRSIFTNSSGILFSRLTGLLRDVLMATALGASVWSDLFFVAFKLPNLFRRIFAEGAFTQAFMPSFVAARHKSVFAVTVLLRFLLFIALLSLLVSLFPELVTKALAWGWSWERIAQAAPLTAINFWYLDAIFVVTFFASLLQYKEHFATTAASTALLNLSMIAALWWHLKADPKTVAYALSIAVVVGGLLQIVAHLIALHYKRLDRVLCAGWRYRQSKSVTQDWQRFKSLFVPGIAGNAAPQLSSFLDTTLATFLASGSVSYLFYANRVFQLPLAIFAIATTTALFPSISKALRHNDKARAYKSLYKAFWFLLILLTLAMIGGIVFSDEVVWLLFERGKFGELERIATSEVLRMYMVGLIPYGLAKLFSLYLYATHRHKEAAKITFYALAVSLLFSLVLMFRMHAAGLALAGSIGGIVLLALTLRRIEGEALRALFSAKMLAVWAVGSLLFVLMCIEIEGILRHYLWH